MFLIVIIINENVEIDDPKENTWMLAMAAVTINFCQISRGEKDCSHD